MNKIDRPIETNERENLMSDLFKTARAVTQCWPDFPLLLASGCATPTRLAAVPENLQNQAQLPGLEDVRYRIGNADDLAKMAREGMESVKREQAYLETSGHWGSLPPAVYLAISGGGDNGRVRRRAAERLDDRRRPADLRWSPASAPAP